MVSMMLVGVAFGAEAFTVEALEIDNRDLGDDFDHAAFREDVRDLDAELGTMLASTGWYTVGVQGALSPVQGRLWGLGDALTVAPTFVATARATIPAAPLDEEDPSYTTQSNAHVRTDAAGRVVAAAGGVVEHSFGCGSYTGYTDWLVTYDAEGNPNLFYSTENGHGEELVLHTETVGQVEYEDGVPKALDVRTRQQWIGCDLCSNDLVGTDDWDDVSWSHVRYVFVTGDADIADAEGC